MLIIRRHDVCTYLADPARELYQRLLNATIHETNIIIYNQRAQVNFHNYTHMYNLADCAARYNTVRSLW